MNRAELQLLSRIRQREARTLLKAGEYAGAYYLAGYSVECALKACIAKQRRRSEFPDKGLAERAFSHVLKDLFRVAELWSDFNAAKDQDLRLDANWTVLKDWKPEARYNPNRAAADARDMCAACKPTYARSTLLDQKAMVELRLSKIRAGRELLIALDEAGERVSAALWLLFPDTSTWTLLLELPEYDEKGPKKAYEAVQAVLVGIGEILEKIDTDDPDVLRLDDVSIVRPKAPVLALLRLVVGTPSKAISGIRFQNNVINGHAIDDAYIYRLEKAPTVLESSS